MFVADYIAFQDQSPSPFHAVHDCFAFAGELDPHGIRLGRVAATSSSTKMARV